MLSGDVSGWREATPTAAGRRSRRGPVRALALPPHASRRTGRQSDRCRRPAARTPAVLRALGARPVDHVLTRVPLCAARCEPVWARSSRRELGCRRGQARACTPRAAPAPLRPQAPGHVLCACRVRGPCADDCVGPRVVARPVRSLRPEFHVCECGTGRDRVRVVHRIPAQ